MRFQDGNRKYRGAASTPPLYLVFKPEETGQVGPGEPEKVPTWVKTLGYAQATVRTGDGHAGWPEEAPFDGAIVTAAAPSVPPALVAQLKPGGCLVIPVGRAAETQHLQRIEKRTDGPGEAKSLLPVAFVPLTRGQA